MQKSTFSKNHFSNFFDIFAYIYIFKAYSITALGEIRRRIRIFGQIWLLTSLNRYLVKKINKKIWFFRNLFFFQKSSSILNWLYVVFFKSGQVYSQLKNLSQLGLFTLNFFRKLKFSLNFGYKAQFFYFIRTNLKWKTLEISLKLFSMFLPNLGNFDWNIPKMPFIYMLWASPYNFA